MEEVTATIVVLTQCGEPLFVMALNNVDIFVGYLTAAPQDALAGLARMLGTEGALIIEEPIEALSGLTCV